MPPVEILVGGESRGVIGPNPMTIREQKTGVIIAYDGDEEGTFYIHTGEEVFPGRLLEPGQFVRFTLTCDRFLWHNPRELVEIVYQLKLKRI